MAKPKPKARSTSRKRRRKISGPRADKARKPKGLRARKPAKSIKARRAPKSLKARRLRKKTIVRSTAKKIGRAVRKIFKGGKTKKVGGSFKPTYEVRRRPRSIADREKALRRIGVAPYKGTRKRTAKQKKKIAALYDQFSEFTGRPSSKVVIIATRKKNVLTKAERAGMAVYGNHIYVHIARAGESAKLSRFMGEDVIARTYYGKRERIFLGGADVFDRVVAKLQAKKLPKGQMITGAFFGGPSFHRAIYRDVNDFLNYLNNQFVPHLAKGVKPTRRNIARAKAALIKNIAVVNITNPEFEEDDNDGND